MQRLDFCGDWTFSRDGADFKPVVVPHDAMLEAGRDANAPAGSNSGYFRGGAYRYRKEFHLDRAQADGAVWLVFE